MTTQHAFQQSLYNTENETIVTCYWHGVSLKDIAGDIDRHTSTFTRFLDRHNEGVRKYSLKSTKKLSDKYVSEIMSRVYSSNFSVFKIKSSLNLLVSVRRV